MCPTQRHTTAHACCLCTWMVRRQQTVTHTIVLCCSTIVCVTVCCLLHCKLYLSSSRSGPFALHESDTLVPACGVQWSVLASIRPLLHTAEAQMERKLSCKPSTQHWLVPHKRSRHLPLRRRRSRATSWMSLMSCSAVPSWLLGQPSKVGSYRKEKREKRQDNTFWR